MFWIELREVLKLGIILTLVGGLTGKLVLILINWLIRLVSIKKIVGAILIHLLLILVLVAFGFFFYWTLRPNFLLENVVDFAELIFLEIVMMVAGYCFIELFKKEKNKEGKK